MEKIPCTQISLTDKEIEKLRGKQFGMFGLEAPWVGNKETKEDMIRRGTSFIRSYEKMGETVNEWRKLLEELNQ